MVEALTVLRIVYNEPNVTDEHYDKFSLLLLLLEEKRKTNQIQVIINSTNRQF
jgi:hypothetical protein